MGVHGGLSKGNLGWVLLNLLFFSGDTWEDCHQVPLSFGRPEMQSSQAQLQTSTQVANDLQLPLDQHLDRGDGKARLHLSPTIRGFTANTDTGDQGPLIQGKREEGNREFRPRRWATELCVFPPLLKIKSHLHREVYQSVCLITPHLSQPLYSYP